MLRIKGEIGIRLNRAYTIGINYNKLGGSTYDTSR